jgi:hypothetical protein
MKPIAVKINKGTPKERIKEGIDEIFCKRMAEKGINPPLHWGFGVKEK